MTSQPTRRGLPLGCARTRRRRRRAAGGAAADRLPSAAVGASYPPRALARNAAFNGCRAVGRPKAGASRRRDSVASAFQASRHATPAVAAAADKARGPNAMMLQLRPAALVGRAQPGLIIAAAAAAAAAAAVPAFRFRRVLGPACSRCPRACWPEQRECAHHGRADRFGAFYLHSEMRPSQDVNRLPRILVRTRASTTAGANLMLGPCWVGGIKPPASHEFLPTAGWLGFCDADESGLSWAVRGSPGQLPRGNPGVLCGPTIFTQFHGMPFAYAQLSERPPTMRPLGDDD
ncbi:hypothetical protein PCL_04418 [Purpureocillium lilacinum]|uniref:Uncharacterized protein n=1 Tax=Purpureocillium lilacinum TaxID=33203 RepID=A0A2U3DXE8_PURLI|nr:hypothetical protein PCL_04418 [Purpureocillium lilacinum]